jgi:hypothetical protein
MALLTSVPGGIPGLLRQWSPVLVTIDSDQPPVRGMVLEPVIEPDEPDARCRVWNTRNGCDNKAAMFVALDLTDPTGRAHAAWWLMDRWRSGPRMIVADRVLVINVCRFAEQGADMTPEQIDAMARLVLRHAVRALPSGCGAGAGARYSRTYRSASPSLNGPSWLRKHVSPTNRECVL